MKGRETERLVVEAYDHAGWERVFQPPKAKYTNQDIFGLFDIVAYHPAVGLRFSQVKTNQTQGELGSFFEDSEFLAGEDRVSCEFVVYHDGTKGAEGFRVARRDGDTGYTWEFDNRDSDDETVSEGLTTFLKQGP